MKYLFISILFFNCFDSSANNEFVVSELNTFDVMVEVASTHPNMTLTVSGIKKIRAGIGNNPLFDKQLNTTIQLVDLAISEGIDIPMPKDMAGGYTHEQHKSNYKLMHNAGNIYQLTQEKRYAELVKNMLLEYAVLYPTLPLHPTNKSYSTGKIFWQCLNDANWLVYTSQAYDCIYDYLSDIDRQNIEINLFIPFANFLSDENPKFFNRIHNHSTWANAAVGMIALAMDNDSLLSKALYGLNYDVIKQGATDDDGGYIKKKGVTKAGFLAQLDYSFSPDGYFSEGPYYQRYAIFPFLVFSHALHNKKPELDIFNYRDGILKKATSSLLQLTNTQGHFFPINDAQKGMSFNAYELINAVDLMYMVDDTQTYLLDWAAAQNEVVLNEAGYNMSEALSNHKAATPKKKSVIYNDGVDGNSGGVAVLRSKNLEVLFKYSTQGMGHGHFDRLSYSLYDDEGEIIQDYGAVRWVNVDQKAGGRYLPENKTFGKQTISHNTVVVNGTSQYQGKVKQAEKSSPAFYFSDISDDNFQVVSAFENNAYLNTSLHRTLYLIEDEDLDTPIFLDLMKVKGSELATVELPLWYVGHFMKSSFDCPKAAESMTPLGADNGYQHIWKESDCETKEAQLKFNWFSNDRFYTLTALSEEEETIVMGRVGANDPNYNLRSDPVLIQKRKKVNATSFISVVEPHGDYDRATEIPMTPYSQIDSVKKLYEDEDFIITEFSTGSHKWTVMLTTTNNNSDKKHIVIENGITYEWIGVTDYKKEKI